MLLLLLLLMQPLVPGRVAWMGGGEGEAEETKEEVEAAEEEDACPL